MENDAKGVRGHIPSFSQLSAHIAGVSGKCAGDCEGSYKIPASVNLALCSFLEIQKTICAADIPEGLRVVLYRRFMMRIAERIAGQEECKALVTGDSLGQVASQTLENIVVISAATTMPILRPLIGENKDDIITTATAIGTATISAQPYEDCCSLFVPEHPGNAGKHTGGGTMRNEIGNRKAYR